MNLLLKVSRFFHDLQVNVLLTKIFLDFLFQKALLIICKRRDFNRYKRYSEQIHLADIQHLNDSTKAKQRHLQINLKISLFCSCRITQALNANKMNPFGISFILHFLKLTYGSKLQSLLLKFFNRNLFSCLHLVTSSDRLLSS